MSQLPYPETHEDVENLKKDYASRKRMKRIQLMHNKFGTHPGEHCGNCMQLSENICSNKYFKCQLYGVSASAATDWRYRWPACGKFEPRMSQE